MVRTTRGVLLAALVLSVGSVGGCEALKKKVKQKEALIFNNKLADFNKRISRSATALGNQVKMRLQGKPVTDKALDDGLAKLKATVAAVRKETQAMKVPDDVLARELFKKYEAFLDGQERLVKKVEELVKLVKQPLGAKKAKARVALIRKVQPILMAIQKEEQGSLQALQAVQRRYAAKYNISLTK